MAGVLEGFEGRVFEESDDPICIICLGPDTKPIPPGCGHCICSSCLSNEPLPASCCPECQDFYQLDPQADMALYPEGEGKCEIDREEELFGDDGETPLRGTWPESEDGEDPPLWPIAVAAQHHGEKIQSNLQLLCAMGGKVQEPLGKEEEEPLVDCDMD